MSTNTVELVQEFIKFRADVNIIDINHIPLITACNNGSLSIPRVLIKASTDVNFGNEMKLHLLMHVIKVISPWLRS